MASIDVYRYGVFFCPACRVGFYALFAGYLSVGLGAQGWMVMSSFSVVLWVMRLVLSVAGGAVRAAERF